MDFVPRESMRSPPRGRPRWVVPALLAVAFGLMVLSGVLHWPTSEPEARRRLCLRAAELDGWLRQELLVSQQRPAFARPGGAEEAASHWRAILAAVDHRAARVPATGPQLPAFAAGDPLEEHVRAARDARRFTPFASIEALLRNEWLRGAHVLRELLVRSPSTAEQPITPWLDVALVYAADLRATGLLDSAVAAAELEEAIDRRLRRIEEPCDEMALQELAEHTEAALATLPPPSLVAEREACVAQARACCLAAIPPFELPGDEPGGVPSWPLIQTAVAVERLAAYDDHLRGLLAPQPNDRARRSFDGWVESLAQDAPLAVTLLADGASLIPARTAATRLTAILEQASTRLGAPRSSR